MSRIQTKAEKEPLMRMQRPSSASSQTTAHVLNSCFGDLLLDCQPVDAERIENLKVTKVGADQFHCSYVAALQKAYDEYRSRLSELSRLEQHLVKARTEALVEEETRVAQLKREYPDYEKMGLPAGPSLFTKYLDEDLLQRHHLLRPSAYLPETSQHYEGPKAPTEPNYYSTTHSFSQHARVSPSKAPNTSTRGKDTTAAKEKPLWKGVLSAEEREEGKTALSELARRSQFMKNPRYKASSLSNTAASGAARDGKLAEVNRRADVESTFFIAEPPEVLFTEYEKGRVHEATIVLRNVSSASHQLRVLPPQTPFFSVSLGRFPTEDGLVAPGMSCSYTVRFTPDSLADFQDELKFLLHTGDSFVVPLKGHRPAPDLTLPVYLDCGACLAGSFQEVVVTCRNEGGEGGFVLYSGDTPIPFLNAKGHCTFSEDCLEVGPFTVSPTAFHLPPGATIDVKIAFRPDVVGECSERFTMACDNCSVVDITVTGKAESLSVGVSGVENCSEREQTMALSAGEIKSSVGKEKTSTSCLALELSDDGLEDGCVFQTNLGHTTVAFDNSNPHQLSHKKVTIKNMSHTAVPFKWVVYVPLVHGVDRASDGKEEGEGEEVVCESLVESLNSPFVIRPDKGVLEPKEARTFFVTFCPQKVGQFIDMAHLVLEDLPRAAVDCGRFTLLRTEGTPAPTLCSVSALSLELSAVCETYQVQLSPPCLNLLGLLQPGVTIERAVQVVNHSVSNIEFEWTGMELMEATQISVEPNAGSVVAGRQFTCNVAITPTVCGAFEVPLLCRIKHAGHPLACPVHFTVQGPSLSIEVPSLNFGLVQVGHRSTLAVPIWNGSCGPVKFTVSLSSLPAGHSGVMRCLQLSHTSGELPSRGRVTLLATFEPSEVGHLRCVLVFAVEGGEKRYVEVRGEAQRPVASLDCCQLHLEKVYLNVPAEGVVRLLNHTLLATRFRWSEQYVGEGASAARLSLSPREGTLGPREEVAIKYEIVWAKQGSLPPLLATCLVDEMDAPLHLSISGQVEGMAVRYELVEEGGQAQPTQQGQTADTSEEGHPVHFDFGSSCPLGEERQLTLKVVNLSGIASSFHAHVVHLPAATSPAPPSKSKPSNAAKGMTSPRKKPILSRTTNLADPRSKTDRESVKDHHQLLLRDGRGACFAVEPAQSDLPPFSSRTVTLRALSDMWGQYQDRLVIRVDGVENDESFPISYGVDGCPVKFVNTCSEGTSGLRYGSHPASTFPLKRTIKLHNTAPIDIRVDWETYCILPESQDDKLVDLVLRIGEPFPLLEETVTQCLSSRQSYKSNLSLTSASGREAPSARQGRRIASSTKSNSEVHNAAKDALLSSSANMLPEKQRMPEDEEIKEKPLIRSFLVVHEGVKSSYPYSIEPQQVILPARGYATLTISFMPSLKALAAYGKRQEAYALGFMTLDDSCTKCGPAVLRVSGDAVVPLRLDLTALIQHAQLSLTSDDNDEVDTMTLRTRADVLIGPGGGVLPSVLVETCYLLRNFNDAELEFSLSVSKPFSLALVDPATQRSTISTGKVLLKPRKSLQVKLLLTLTTTFVQELIAQKQKSATEADATPLEVGVSGELTVEYSTEATQAWPVKAVVLLPQLSLSHGCIDFGCGFVEQTVSKSFSLHNHGYSSALWTAQLQTGHQFFVLDPLNGVVQPHLTKGRESKAVLTVSCHPVSEEVGRDVVVVRELLTDWQGLLPVSGSGSADERVVSK